MDVAVGDDGARAVSTCDVSVVREAPVHRPDGVRVDAQGGPELADGRQSNARLEPAGFDLVGQLPVDLRGDRDIGITLNIEPTLGG